VLQALTECRRDAFGADTAALPTDVLVRARYDDMRICLKGRGGLRFEASTIYRCLRQALLERPIATTAPVA
jgi:hypothetical protein